MRTQKGSFWVRAMNLVPPALIFSVALAGVGGAQESNSLRMERVEDVPILEIKTLKPVPEVRRPRHVPRPDRRGDRAARRGDSFIHIDGSGTLCRIDHGSGEMVIGDSIRKMSDHMKYYVGENEYRRMPPEIHRGVDVAFAVGEDGRIAKVWRYRDIEENIE